MLRNPGRNATKKIGRKAAVNLLKLLIPPGRSLEAVRTSYSRALATKAGGETEGWRPVESRV